MLEVTPCADTRDEQVSLDVYNAVWPHAAFTLAEVHSFKQSVRAHHDVVARLDGAPVGSALTVVVPHRSDRVLTVVTVLASHRRRGVGSALFASLSAWTGERGIADIEVPVLDNDPESLAYATRRGFVEERRELGVVLDVAGMEQPALEPPEGIEIVAWAERPELARGIYEVSLEAYPDIPGFEDDELESFEDWLAHDMQGSGDLPEATFVALADDEVVGYAKFALTAAQPTVAFHDISGVKRAWRGRGVARALKTAQIRWAIANGFTELRTRNEERNEPIRRLNASLGYRPGIGRVYLVGPLAR
ncbi:MAG TPA: GNAT family N-acetyltransferase [Gaiella sp.]|nr:GNAT family N-acetyltransferase [Gaiella sp.]